MRGENIIYVDFCSRRVIGDDERSVVSAEQYSRHRYNKISRHNRQLRGLPTASNYRETMPYAFGLYCLVRDKGSPESIKSCQDKVSELLLTLDDMQSHFFARLVERELGIEDEISWIDSIDSQALEGISD